MKTLKHIRFNIMMLLMVSMLFSIAACELEDVEPETNTASGGGTLTTYSAYSIDPATALDSVYGRVVFWEGNAGTTLVQISLYKTGKGIEYITGVYDGKAVTASDEKLMTLYSIDGATGEFSTHKYYVISDPAFYSSLKELNGHIKIMVGTKVVASGDVGANAEPVAEGD
ncbi:hypothetical protein [Chryseosolibacter indicus]|uniref:CHRD domain-containing protein n=1 Tax=Chryseosolibacter indicus TaxID=2782351 RepID=A0ABS5VYD1_9BACT|nr:hypothetical protein [Chryseosolibacter indicus]MBT1706073.1 hypothetical protein [Chryseosolibacter indicus]